MKAFYTNAVESVAEQLISNKQSGTPGRVLIGAGCSVSNQVPTAPQLIEQIKEKFSKAASKIPRKLQNSYPDVLEAIPDNTRRQLILEATENKPIGLGYIALARLMEDGFVECVLSLNFDTQLQKACSLINFHPSIYDFSVAPQSDLDKMVLPSIVHLHGQSYGYVHRHTKQETAPHLKKLEPLVSRSLKRSTMMVCGYSGESDEFVSLLEKQNSSETSLFWLSLDLTEPRHLNSIMRDKHSHFFGGLEFDAFMVELAKKLNCWPPMILTHPIQFNERLIDGLADFKPAGSFKTTDLRRLSKNHLAKLKKISNSSNVKMSTIEKHVFNMDFDKAVRAYKRSANKTRIAPTPLEKNILSWAFVEESFKLWSEVVDKKHKRLSKKSKLEQLDKAAQLLFTGIQLGEKKEVYAHYQINILAMKFHISKDIKHLKEAQNLYSRHMNSEIELLHYNAMDIYNQLIKIEGKKSKYMDRQLEIWDKLRSINGNRVYHYFCFLAITQNFDEAKKLFKRALPEGILPKLEYMQEDSDLDNLRTQRWFKSVASQTQHSS